MGGLFESKQKTTTTQKTQVPSNFQNLMNRTIQFANEGLDTPFESYNAPRIAELSQNEQAGIASAGANAGMYQDLINMAGMNNAAMQLQGGVPTQGDLNQFMNPYVDYVLGNTLGRLNEASDRNMTNIGGMAGMAGAFGGSRHGVLEGANLAELLKSTQEASANSYSDAFDKGMGNWFNSQNLRRGTISDALNIAQGGQNYNNNDINALMSTGLTERTRNQGVLDFAYSEFMREQQDPFTKAGFAGSVMQQYPTNLFTRTGVSETTNTPSPISQIAGIGMAAAGLMTGNPAAMAGLGVGQKAITSGPMQGVNITGVGGQGTTNNWGTTIPYKKGGKVKGYRKGGKVEDITSLTNPDDVIGALIREIEAKENASRVRILPDNMEAYTRHEETPRSTPDIFGKGHLPTQVYDLLAPLFEGEDRYIKETPRKPGGKAEKRTQKFLNDQQEFLTRSSRNRAGLEHRLNKQYVDPNEKLPPEAIEALQNLLQEKFNTVPQEQGFAKGGKVVKPGKDGVYRAGGGGWFDDIMSAISPAYWFADQNPEGTPESRQMELEMRQAEGGYGTPGNFLRGDRQGGQATTQAQPSTPRQPFNWEAFIQRHGLQSFQTPQFPNSATPRLPAQGPQLGQFVSALQSKLNPSAGQGTPRGVSPNMPGYKEGGEVRISGNKSTRRSGSTLTHGMKHDGSLEDITYLLDEIPDEEWTATEGSWNGIGTPVEKDRRKALRLALQKHETAAKDYNNPNYFANSFKGKEDSHAFGLGQWQPGVWNQMAAKINKGKGDKVRLMSQDDVKADRLPTKVEQDRVWDVWEKEIVKGHGKDYGRAFAEHQLGAGDLDVLERYSDDTPMKNIPFSKGGPRIAKNVSALKETKGQYLARLNKMIDDGEKWDFEQQVARGGNPTDVLAGFPMNQSAMAAERPHNFGPVSEARLREIMRKRGDSVFTGVQPDGRRDRIRRGPDLGEALSPLETVMGGKLPIPPDEDYLKQMIPGLVEKQELEAPSRFVKGGVRPFNRGGYVKGYAGGGPTDPHAPHSTDEDVTYRWNAADHNEGAQRALDDLKHIWSLKRKGKSGIAIADDFLGKTFASGVPLAGYAGANIVGGASSVFDFLFNDAGMDKPAKWNSGLPAESEDLKKIRRGAAGLGDLRMDPPNYGQGETTGAEAFNGALEAGEPSEIVESAADKELSSGDRVNNALQEMIMGEIEARKTREERDPNKLFGMNVNMPLIKMGLGILANSGYPNSAGEAIGKGVLGALEGEENDALKKQERDSGKLKELVNLRYMQAMVESMDPNIKSQLQKEKAAQEFAAQRFKSDYEFQQWLSKQNYSEEMQMRLIKFRADIAAQQNNPFGNVGEGRIDKTGE